MSFLKDFKDRAVAERMLDEELYAIAIHEFESGERRDGLWAKAIVQGEGDERRTEAAYLSLLVQKFKDEHYVGRRFLEEAGKSPSPTTVKTTKPQRTESKNNCFHCQNFHAKGWDQSIGRCSVHNKKVKASLTCEYFEKS